MFKKLTLAAAAGAGYVLGAKAGKERYAQIEATFREIAGMPAVQNAAATVKENAAPLLDTAKETVSAATDKASGGSSTGSSSAGGGGSAGSTASAAPAAGAAGTNPPPPSTAPIESPPDINAPSVTPDEPPIIRS